MSVYFKNDKGESFGLAIGHYDMLCSSGVGIIAGWACSYRKGACVYTADDEFFVDRCDIFALLLRKYADILTVRAEMFEKKHNRKIADKDRTFDENAVSSPADIEVFRKFANWCERSLWIRA